MKVISSRIVLIPLLCFLVTLTVNSTAVAQRAPAQTQVRADSLEGKVFAEAFLVTNYVERGITHSDKSPAIQSGFGYQWSQFRLGIWGSSVRYRNSDDNVLLRFFGAYKFLISQNVDLSVKYAMGKYQKSGTRDGNITGADLQMFTYHVTYETIDNFEGSETMATRFGFGKEWNFYWDTTLDVNGGYNSTTDSGFSNFADVRVSWKKKWQDIHWGLAVTYNSAASEFNGRADPFIFGSAGVAF